MSSEIQIAYGAAGITAYAQVRKPSGATIWNGSSFETYSSGNWTDYDVALTEQGSSGYYAANFPTGITDAGKYIVTVFEQEGASPAEGDAIIGSGTIEWDGANAQRDVMPQSITVPLGIVEQSTAIEILVGPFLSPITGQPQTSLTVTAITANLIKHGAPPTSASLSITASGGSNDMVHLADGIWRLELTTSNTDTVGTIIVTMRDPDQFIGTVYAIGQVVVSNTWDSLIGGTDVLKADVQQILGVTATASAGNLLDVNVAEISESSAKADALEAAIDSSNNWVTSDIQAIDGDTTSADSLKLYTNGSGNYLPVNIRAIYADTSAALNLNYMCDASHSSTVNASAFTPTTTAFDTNLSETTTDHYKDRYCLFQAGALAGQMKKITAYAVVGGLGRITVDALTEAPAGSDVFTII